MRRMEIYKENSSIRCAVTQLSDGSGFLIYRKFRDLERIKNGHPSAVCLKLPFVQINRNGTQKFVEYFEKTKYLLLYFTEYKTDNIYTLTCCTKHHRMANALTYLKHTEQMMQARRHPGRLFRRVRCFCRRKTQSALSVSGL